MKARVVVETDGRIGTIHPDVYGHFAEHLGNCIAEGLWVGRDSPIPNENGIRRDVVAALKRLRPPVVRWPGGCFADDYHWQDGIGDPAQRPRRINVHWGAVIEDNHFGTHEFMEFCRQVGARPYVCGNMGSGTVREMRDWLEYMNCPGDSTWARTRAANGHPAPFDVRYFGVGNENWGCGGNMTAEYYAEEVRRYSAFLLPFGGAPLCKIACGPCGDEPEWTRRFFEALSVRYRASAAPERAIQGFAMHYYCGTAGTATEYTETQWYELLEKALRIEAMIVKHRGIMDGFDPQRKIGLILDEWGTWHPPMAGTNPKFLRQQSTVRDALVAALSLDAFNRHADKVVMTNIAQTVNVLQAMAMTDGPRMFLTPTFHVYEMYAPHQGAESLPLRVEGDAIRFSEAGGGLSVPRVSGSCSRKGAALTLTLVNAHACEPMEVSVELRGAKADLRSWTVLAADDIHAHNEFDAPDRVAPRDNPTGGRKAASPLILPPASVNKLVFGME